MEVHVVITIFGHVIKSTVICNVDMLILLATKGPEPTPRSEDSQSWWPILVTVAMFIIIVTLLFGVLVTVARKRARGTTWFPEGFFSSVSTGTGIGAKPKTRRVPDGQELK